MGRLLLPRFAASALLAWCLALASCLSVPRSAGPIGRQNLNFNPDWKFLKADPGPGTAEPAFDDHAWTTVSAPHTFNDVDSFDHWSVPGHRGEQGTWGGVTWYRKTFTAPPAWAGREVYIEFEAVRQVAEVYLNGHRLGVSKTGFTPFGFDLTPYLRADGSPNVLALRCDNRFMKDPMDVDNLGEISKQVNAAVPADVEQLQADQIPWNNPHWHPAHGGIYRNVTLHVVDPLHISLPLYSFLRTEGPYVYASDLSADSARLNLEVPVQNGRAAAATAELQVAVRDAAGRIVLRLEDTATIAAGASAVFKAAGPLAHPERWEPDYPYLYRVEIALKVNGETIDTDAIPYGIRAVRFDAQAGFFINGHHLKLHGWGQKPTDEWPGLGAAQPDWMHFYTLDLMKKAGGNWVRWGHSAPGPVMIEAGDVLGIMAEEPGVDGESDTVGAAWKLRMTAWRDMLIYFRNHPSIVIWEGGNQHVTDAHAKELRATLDRIDPHGGRAFAFRRADQTDAKYMDVGIGTEGGREIARLPVVEGEYDREESPRRVWDKYSPPNFGYPEAADPTQNAYDLTSEEYAVNEVGQYVRKVGAANSSGGANWLFSDSTSGGRVRVEVARASGEVDGSRLPKEAYYVCAAMFRSDPQVAIIGHWTYPAGTKKPVYVASNGDDVELFVNGHSLGHGRRSDRYLFTFPAVTWVPGEIKAVAYLQGRPIATDTKRTAGPPVSLRLTPILGPGGLLADGSDVALIDVEAVDARGERCPTVQQRVDFDCEGPAVWRGGYDSGKINSINNLYLDLEAGINRVAVRSTLTPGSVTVRARSAGLAPASLTLVSRPFPVADGMSTVLPALPVVPLPAARPAVAASDAAVAASSPGPAAAAQPGRYIKTFNYTGPTSIAHVEMGAQDGKNAYVDRDTVFRGLPASLRGADWVQAGAADALYSAVDFMQLAVSAGTTVSIAHDDRLARPAWLIRQFRPTATKLVIDGHPMAVFSYTAARDESLTLGSNTDDPNARAANMYLVFAHAEPSRADLWVSPAGDDANPGTATRPLRTLEAARDRVRTLNRNLAGDLTVFIGGGTYRLARPLVFGPADSGTGGHAIIYRSDPGSPAILSGGVAVTGWQLVDPARNLWAAPAPPGLTATRQLYVNGVRAPRAQGRLPVALHETATGYVADSAVMAGWRNPSDLEFVYTGGNSIWSEPSVGLGSWTEPRCPVASIDGTTITMVQPAWDNSTKRVMYADPKFRRTANLVGPASVGRQPAYVENAYELLGTPGQWYFDRPAAKIYYVPRAGEDLAKADVEAPLLETLIAGEASSDQPVRNLVFQGLRFEYATWLFPSGPEGFPEIQANYLVTGPKGYAVQGLGHLAPGGLSPYGAWTKTPGNVRFTRSSGVKFIGDAFVHLGAAGLELGDGSQGDTVEGCVFTDISGNGCELGGVDLPLAGDDLITRDNRIVDNHFYNIGAEYHGGIGIVVGYAQRTQVAHNQIDHVPYAAISMGWGGWPDKVHQAGVANDSRENVVAQNLIFQLMLVLSDGGGIYTQGLTGPTLAEGEQVTGNVIHDQYSSGHAIYTDNGSCNITVAGNVMFRTNHDNWGSRHGDYYGGANGSANDPLAILGNYWQQGDPDSSAKNVTEAGNHLISSLDQVPAAIRDAAGLEPAYRQLLDERFGKPVAPEAPNRVAADAEDGFAYVTWSPSRFEGGSPILSYEVTSSAGDKATISDEEFRTRGCVKVGGLVNGRPCTFAVAAVNAVGASPPSLPSRTVVPGQRAGVVPPGIPLHVSVRAKDGNASIHWEAPSADGGAPIVAYVVTVSPGGRQMSFEGRKVLVLGTSPATGRGHQTFEVLGGVAPAPDLSFSLAAVNAAGAGVPAVVKAEP